MANVQITGVQIKNAAIDSTKLDMTAAYDFSGASSLLVPTPGSGSAAATKTYVDDLVSQGISWKQYAKVKADSNVSTTSAPSSIDGVTMSADDRVLLTGQSTDSKNGIYVWASAGSAMTRASDADSFSELQHASIWIQSGTHADKQFIQKADLTNFQNQDWIEITSSSVANGSVTNASVANDAAIAFSKLAPLNSGQILVGSAGNAAAAVALSGDATMANTGAMTIAGGAIDNAKISNTAAIALSKLEAVADGKILIGNVSNQPAAQTISGDATITNAGALTISAGAIDNGKIDANAAIALSKLAAVSSGQIIVGSAGNQAAAVAMSGDAAMANNGALTIAAGAIDNAKIDANAAIALTKLENVTDGSILVGNSSNKAAAVAVSGDITISNTGVTSFNGAVIVDADINAGAAIAHNKLAALTSGQILVGSAGNAAAAVAVSGDASLSNAGLLTIGAGAIDNGKIDANAAIDYTKLAACASGKILVGNASNQPAPVSMSGDATISNAGAVQLASSVAGNGITGGGGAALAVDPDGTTIAISASGIKVGDAQITATQLSTACAGNGLTGGAGSALAVQNDGATISVGAGGVSVGIIAEANIGTDAVTAGKIGARFYQEGVQVSGSTTGTIDLGRALNSNTMNSVLVFKNGLALRNMTALSGSALTNDEFTVANNGAGSVGRITFGANLLNSDAIMIWYFT